MSADLQSYESIRPQARGLFTRRGLLVPSFYRQPGREHPESAFSAVVTKNGEPISVHGDTLTVGKCPPEYRWAIGPAEDGKAEVLDQRTFEELHRLWYEETYLAKGAKDAGDPNLRPIPRSERFVSWKVDPVDESKLVPLGTGMQAPRPEGEPKLVYVQSGDKLVDAETWKKEHAKDKEGDYTKRAMAEQAAELERLRAELEAAREARSQPDEPGSPEPEPEPPQAAHSAVEPEAMPFPKLKQYAKKIGLTVPLGTTKAETLRLVREKMEAS